MNHIYSDPVVYLVSICWLIVAVGAICAVLSHKIRDSLHERIALAGVALGAAAVSYGIFDQGWTTERGRWLAIAAAYYVLAIFVKKWDDDPEVTPRDKCSQRTTEVPR